MLGFLVSELCKHVHMLRRRTMMEIELERDIINRITGMQHVREVENEELG